MIVVDDDAEIGAVEFVNAMSNVFEAQGRMGFAVRRVGGTDAKVYQPARTLSNPRY